MPQMASDNESPGSGRVDAALQQCVSARAIRCSMAARGAWRRTPRLQAQRLSVARQFEVAAPDFAPGRPRPHGTLPVERARCWRGSRVPGLRAAVRARRSTRPLRAASPPDTRRSCAANATSVAAESAPRRARGSAPRLQQPEGSRLPTPHRHRDPASGTPSARRRRRD